MRILDKYILVSFLKTFLSVFVVLVFIFILQTIWLYISELAGKDLDIIIVFKFIFYFLPKLVPLVLPLSILLASIMVFGSFAENYEFAAMKSSGISLQRAMRSLIVFIAFLSLATFFFANNVIPWSEYKSYNLRRNIARLKPAMVIVEGQFNDVGNMNIKIDEKYGDRDQYLRHVIIHKKEEGQNENFTTIIAQTGELKGSEDSNILQLILNDGYYYDDIQTKDYKRKRLMPHAKSAFQRYTINIDLSSLNDVDFQDESFSNSSKMLKVNALNRTIDSVSVAYNQDYDYFKKNTLIRTGLEQISTIKYQDTVTEKSDDILLSLNSYQNKIDVLDLAINAVLTNKGSLESKKKDLKIREKNLNKYEIALHEKFAISFACIVLFFVGAPLGAIIRKGGLGLPMVIAIVLFVTYHFVGIFGRNSAEEGGLSPWIAAWLPTIIMLPLGIFFTRQATADKGVFKWDDALRSVVTFVKNKFTEFKSQKFRSKHIKTST
ncbi:MAG: LptF/LptG family permease [Flavobacteriaceae bacterium]|nr:LptF/LptG family permease [Flavobacteriaceae bacterium]